MDLKVRLLVEALVAVGNGALVSLSWLLRNLDCLLLLDVSTKTVQGRPSGLTFGSDAGGDVVCLAWMALMRVSTSVAKEALLPSVGSDVERLRSAE